MATPQENLARFQEIARRGIQDQLPPEKKEIFDEAVRRGLVSVGQPATQQPRGQSVTTGNNASGGNIDRVDSAPRRIGHAGKVERELQKKSEIESLTDRFQAGEITSQNLSATQSEAVQQEIQRRRPEIGSEVSLSEFTGGEAGAGTGLLQLTTADPEEFAKILQSQVPGIQYNQTKEGVINIFNQNTGQVVQANREGFSPLDAIQSLGIASLFTPAGSAVGSTLRAAGAGVGKRALAQGLTGAATQTGAETAQALAGGSFDVAPIALAGVTGAASEALLPITQAAGRKAKDVATKAGGIARDVAKIKTPATKDIARRLQAGDIDADTAMFNLAEEGVTDPTAIQKLLGVDLPKVVPDKQAASAGKQGFSSGFLDSVKKRGTAADKNAMLEMTKISQRALKDPLFGTDNRAADVAGNVLLDKVNRIKAINRAAGKQIGESKSFLKGKRVPVTQIGDDFLATLDDLKVVIDPKTGKLDFKDSLVSGAGRRKAISDIFGRMSRNKDPDALALHELKQFIDDTVSYGKSVRGLGGKAESALKDLRGNIKQVLDDNFPKYKEANKAYSDSISALDEIQRLAGKRTDLTSDSAAGQLGSLSRRLTGYPQSRSQLRESMSVLDDVLNTHAGVTGMKRLPGTGEGGANIKLLMLYADELDKVLGSAARTSHTGSIETALQASRGPKEFLADKAVEAARNAAGISKEGAHKSMEAFLKSQLKAAKSAKNGSR